MRFRTWPVAALGLGGLLLLVIVSLLTASRRAQEIYTQLDSLNTHHHEVETQLRRLRSDVHLSSIFMRDYLLDQEQDRAPEYRQRLAEFRRTNLTTLTQLRALWGPDGSNGDRFANLQTKLEEYWQAFDPMFGWTPAEKLTRSLRFLRREVLPRREAVLSIAQQIEELNNANTAAQRAEVTRRHAALRSDLHLLLWQSLLLGLAVAGVSVARLRVLEGRSEEQRVLAEEAEQQMRQLSQQLVATQEEERKKLSRELHDHVGQMLTALRMELGRIERLRVRSNVGNVGIDEAVAECRRILDDIVRSVRDLALGLRPSMLDDFGLQAALEWHVRDLGRRCGLRIDLHVDGDFASLPDSHRTCIYRAVQEALTNCIRHSGAAHVRVTVSGDAQALQVRVVDDGCGIDPNRRRAGLGLRGIEERVRELNGTVSIGDVAGGGTEVAIRLPVPSTFEEVTFARAAG